MSLEGNYFFMNNWGVLKKAFEKSFNVNKVQTQFTKYLKYKSNLVKAVFGVRTILMFDYSWFTEKLEQKDQILTFCLFSHHLEFSAQISEYFDWWFPYSPYWLK